MDSRGKPRRAMGIRSILGEGGRKTRGVLMERTDRGLMGMERRSCAG